MRTDPSSHSIHPFLCQWPQLSITFPQAEAAEWFPKALTLLLQLLYNLANSLRCCIAQCDPVTLLSQGEYFGH